MHIKLTTMDTPAPLRDKIYELFKNLTVEEIDAVTDADISFLSDDEYSAYIHRAVALGRKYYLLLIRAQDDNRSSGSTNVLYSKAPGSQTWQLMVSGTMPGGHYYKRDRFITFEQYKAKCQEYGITGEMADELKAKEGEHLEAGD